MGSSLLLFSLLLQSPAQNAVISGHIVRYNNAPAPGVRVALISARDRSNNEATTNLIRQVQADDLGNYRLDDVPPGEYLVQAGPLDAPTYLPGVASLDKAKTVTTRGGEVVEIGEFKLLRPEGLQIFGRIPRDHLGRQRTVVITRGTWNPRFIPPSPSPNQIGASIGPFGRDPSKSFNFDFILNQSLVNTTEGGGIARAIPAVPASSSIPLAQHEEVSEDGTFDIAGLEPGDYSIFIMPSSPFLMTTGTLSNRNVELAWTDPGVTVSGNVGLKETGRYANQKLLLSNAVWDRQLETDSLGHFVFPDVPPGTYALRTPDGTPLSTITVGDKDIEGLAVPALKQFGTEVNLGKNRLGRSTASMTKRSVSAAQLQLMVQSLLEERFQLKVHREMRELPTYELVVTKSGVKMKVSEDQTPPDPRQAFVNFDVSGLETAPLPRGAMRLSGNPYSTTLLANAVPISRLIDRLLQSQADRIIFDKTELKGLFDIRLQFSRESGPAGPDVTAPLSTDPAFPSLFTAIQELGLKLEPSKASLEVVMIDSVQKPKPN